MAQVKITDYRGFEISFDTEKEKFYVFSDRYDTENTKPSFASAKKSIDEYIKENNTFKPFYLEGIPNGYREGHKVLVIGIRKDGLFVYEDENGKKDRLSKYNEKDYIVSDPRNEPLKADLELLKKAQKDLSKKIKETEALLHIKTADDIKPDYLLS